MYARNALAVLLIPLLLVTVAGAEESTVDQFPDENGVRAFSLPLEHEAPLLPETTEEIRFTVEPHDAKKAWKLSGKHSLSRLSLELLRLGPSTHNQKLPEKQSLQKFTFPNEIFEETHLLLSPGQYRLLIRGGKKGSFHISLQGRSVEPPSASEQAFSLPFTGGLLQERQKLSFSVTEENATHLWRLTFSPTLGDSAGLILTRKTPHPSQLISDRVVKAPTPYQPLRLAEGNYELEIIPNSKNAVLLDIESLGKNPFSPSTEEEPNDNVEHAFSPASADNIRGSFSHPKDRDIIRLTTSSIRPTHLSVKSSQEQKISACLHDGMKKRQCKIGTNILTFPHLSLVNSEWYMEISPEDELVKPDYEISVATTPSVKTNFEIEPNDLLEDAALLTGSLVSGDFSGTETDYFFFQRTGKPTLVSLTASGEGLKKLTFFNAAGESVASREVVQDRKKHAQISDLYLMPGKHFLAVQGNQGLYKIELTDHGAPDTFHEKEPNDDEKTSRKLAWGKPHVGFLRDTADKDTYKFHLDKPSGIKLQMTPPKNGSINFNLLRFGTKFADSRGGKAGQPLNYDAFLPAGDYYLTLFASTPSDSAYSLRIGHAAPSTLLSEMEPNNSLEYATEIPESLSQPIRGNFSSRDQDWFIFPAREREYPLTFNLPLGVTLARHSDSKGNRINYLKREKLSDGSLVFSGIIPAHLEHAVALAASAQAPMEYSVFFSSGEKDHLDEEPVKAIFEAHHKVFQAFSPAEQNSPVQLTLKNLSDKDLEVKLGPYTSSHFATIVVPERYLLKAQDTISLEGQLVISPEAPPEKGLAVGVTIESEGNLLTSTTTELETHCSSQPVNAKRATTIPLNLQGTYNAASLYEGAKLLHADGRRAESLFDDSVSVLAGWENMSSSKKLKSSEVSVKLIGEDAHTVVGFALHPLSEGFRYFDSGFPVEFEVLLGDSLDSQKTVLSAELDGTNREQFFSLPSTVSARVATLRISSSSAGHRLGLGEFQVLALPKGPLEERNIALPNRGGRVVSTSPESFTISHLLTESKETPHIRLKSGQKFEAVFGFRNSRAALIDRLRWTQDTSTRLHSFEDIRVQVSTRGPAGPWSLPTEYKLDLQLGVAELLLRAPLWARYVKISTKGVDSPQSFHLPDKIEIFESKDAPASILGAWGLLSSRGPYEATIEREQDTQTSLTNNTSRADALFIEDEKQHHGSVHLGKRVEWFTARVPNNANHVSLTLSGPHGDRISTEMWNGSEKLNPTFTYNESGDVVASSYARPGSEVTFSLSESQRSIVFTWDTSGSVSPYVPAIYETLLDFAGLLKVDEEEVNLVPFEASPLLEEFTANTEKVRSALTSYPRQESSSDLFKSALDSLELFTGRTGSKVLIVISDAATPVGDREAFWAAAEELKPKIFTLGIPSSEAQNGLEYKQWLMRDLSLINGGAFNYLTSQREAASALEGVLCKLRTPAPFSLRFSAEQRAEPQPGLLQVEIRKSQTSFPGAVELILDASGSMLKRTQGKRRIDVARETLQSLVSSTIPPQTSVALRVFGHRKADSCDTELLVNPQTLSTGEVQRHLEKVNAMNLAKTPIAESLLAVSQDLAEVPGKKLIILLTDGEETCDGDPGSAIEELRSKGLDVQVNIVGFAILDKALDEQFSKWAQAGGGGYFKAADQDELRDALDQALSPEYFVENSAGERVAAGRAGDKGVELKPGIYLVYSDDSSTPFRVELESGETERIVLER